MTRLEENWKELKTCEQTQGETLENLTYWVNQLMEDDERHKHNIAEALLSIARHEPGGYSGPAYAKARERIRRDYGLVTKEGGLGFRPARPSDL